MMRQEYSITYLNIHWIWINIHEAGVFMNLRLVESHQVVYDWYGWGFDLNVVNSCFRYIESATL